MNPVERIKYMLKMEAQRPQKDDAGIYIAGGVEAGQRQKAIQECLKVISGKDSSLPRSNDLSTSQLHL